MEYNFNHISSKLSFIFLECENLQIIKKNKQTGARLAQFRDNNTPVRRDHLRKKSLLFKRLRMKKSLVAKALAIKGENT